MRENPRYNVISMRVSDTEREQLDNLVRYTRKSVSDLMREAMLNLASQLEQQELRRAA
jgi:predicted transcriptional regulator